MTTASSGVPAENPLFDLQRTLYASSNYTRRRLHQARLRWVRRAIATHAAAAPLPRAVEYGPGSGIYLPTLAQHCEQVTAADVEDAYLAGIRPLVRELPRLRLVRDDIQESRFEDGSFGLVLCSEVLEHVPDPERSLHTLYRILCPGGIAIVTTPQRYSVLELACKVAFLPGVIHLVRRVYREPVLETGHVSLRTNAAFRRAVDDAGFQVLEHDKFGLYLPVLAEFGGQAGGRLIERLERRMTGSSLDGALWTQAYVLRKPCA